MPALNTNFTLLQAYGTASQKPIVNELPKFGDQRVAEKQISVEFDPSEFPSFDESEEEEKYDDRIKKQSSSEQEKAENSSMELLQIQALKSIKRVHDCSFYEVLSFWKSKEGDRV